MAHPFLGKGKPQVADCVAPDFLDLPSSSPVLNNLGLVLFIIKQHTHNTIVYKLGLAQ